MNTLEGITNPSVDELLDQVDSKYRLVLFAAKRARQINAYYSQLGEGLLENVGPLVSASPEDKPLSIALREINEGMLQYNEFDPETEATVAPADDIASFDFVNPFEDNATEESPESDS
ncbi:MAG: DNA-directed RNA polymerase subunit omega [Propionibacteriaceae bacterium]|nr:DNA-directed RNA polymerase subunit omega [Propionibacteriaceae bacterium]